MADLNARELGWDDEIENDGQDFEIVPEGDYDFQVVGFERERYQGGDKIPPCNKAVLSIKVTSPQASGTVKHNLLLYSSLEWKLCEFFTAIGQRKHGEKLRMNWAGVIGTTGRCNVGIRKWISTKGKECESNEIKKFYEPEDAAGGAPKYTPGEF